MHLDQVDDATIVIDPDIGALHEVNGHFELGPPKTAESARTIQLPPFLVPLLRAHLDSHDHAHVFLTAEGEYLRRSNFTRSPNPRASGTPSTTRSRRCTPTSPAK